MKESAIKFTKTNSKKKTESYLGKHKEENKMEFEEDEEIFRVELVNKDHINTMMKTPTGLDNIGECCICLD